MLATPIHLPPVFGVIECQELKTLRWMFLDFLCRTMASFGAP
jgi:hypothetical protein